MTKTIEELAKQYAKYQTDEQGYGSMEEWKQDVAIYYDDAKEVLSWLFAKPIAQRLTAEEKERVRAIYNRKRYGTEYSKEVEYMEKQLLEHLLGSYFFKEEE